MASSIEACISNLQARPTLASYEDKKNPHPVLSNVISKSRLECRLRLQLCAVLSQLDRHEEALRQAQEAARVSQTLVKETLLVCQEYLAHQRKLLNRNFGKFSESSKTHGEVFKRAIALAQYLDAFITGKTRRNEGEGRLYSLKSADWLMKFSVGTMMTLQSTSISELTMSQSILTELTVDAMVDKARTRQALLLIVSYFSIATELRFKFSKEKTIKVLKEGQAWHLKSIDIAKGLLPGESVLVRHLKESYRANYLDMLSAVRPMQIKRRARDKEAKITKADISMVISRKDKPGSKSPHFNREINKSRSPTPTRSTSAKNTGRYVPKRPETPSTVKLLSAQQSKAKVLRTLGINPLSNLDNDTSPRFRIMSNSQKLIKKTEPSLNSYTVSKVLQTRAVQKRPDPPQLQDEDHGGFLAPVDRYFMDSFVLTSSALYGNQSDEDDEAAELKRNESVDIKQPAAVPSTGGRDSVSDVVLPRKTGSLVKQFQKQGLLGDSSKEGGDYYRG
jgi:hypothetical protein